MKRESGSDTRDCQSDLLEQSQTIRERERERERWGEGEISETLEAIKTTALLKLDRIVRRVSKDEETYCHAEDRLFVLLS